MDIPSDKYLGEFRLGRQLTSIFQVTAIGVVILLGFSLIVSERSVQLVERLAPLTAVLVCVVFGMTLLSVAELFGGSSEHGGTFVLVHELLAGPISFLTGWSILAGCLLLCAALVKTSAVHYLSLTRVDLPTFVPGLALVAGMIIFQLLQFLPRRLQLSTIVTALTVGLFFVLFSDFPAVDLKSSLSTNRIGTQEVASTIAWLCAGYIIFEAVLSNRRQIRNPGQLIPPALLSTLVVTGVFLSAIFLVFSRISHTRSLETAFYANALAENSVLPGWFFATLAGIALPLAANGCLMAGARQVNALIRVGALPRDLRRVWGPFPMPIFLFIFLALLLTPLIIWAPVEWLIQLAATLFIAVMIVLNVSAIQSHRTEPERRRPFTVPFAPLVPAIAIAINVVLLRYTPLPGLASGLIWLLLGVLFYIIYAQRHQVEAQEGEIVFGRRKIDKTQATTCRILVPIGQLEERHLVLNLATALAQQTAGEVVPLQVIVVPDPLAISEGKRIAKERNTLFQWSIRAAADYGVSVFPITRLARSVSEGIIDTAIEEACDLILMPWAIQEGLQSTRIGTVLGRVSREAPCDVAVVSYHPNQLREAKKQEIHQESSPDDKQAVFKLNRLLVPTAGGPNAPLAIRLALLWARKHDASVTAVYVARPDATEEEIEQGNRRIHQTIKTMKDQVGELPSPNGRDTPLEEIPIEGRVVTAPDIVTGIAETGADFNLVLLGATEESLIDQVLFGNIPEQVARNCPSPVLIVRRYRGLSRLWLQRTWNALYEALPKLNAEEQIEIYRSVHRGARPDVDFFVMIGLSTIIATYGLFQNSGAVIIGAMLVAPLFSPLIALSLSIAQGNIRLFRIAVEANLKGMALAIGLAIFLAFISTFSTLTDEITNRSQPALADLIIALASGAAGAYAMARKDVAASLPGVAIAAALVPPLSVIGIGLAIGDLSIATGSGLLFLTNLVAIVLAGSVIFLLLGFRPGDQREREEYLRRGLLITVILFVLITIPLGLFFVQSLQKTQTEQAIVNQLSLQIETISEMELIDREEIIIIEEAGEIRVTVPVYSQSLVENKIATQLSDSVSQAIDRSVRVRLVVQTLVETEP